MRERSPDSPSARCTPSMATLMMSAALPWIGAFNAIRSAISRRCRLSLLRSGRYRRRPRTVSVWDVLQVRFGGGQPTGGRDGLVERGVNSPVVRDRLEQTVHSGLQSGGIAVRLHVPQEPMFRAGVEVLQRVEVGGVAGLGAL